MNSRAEHSEMKERNLLPSSETSEPFLPREIHSEDIQLKMVALP